jgi:protein gp37
MGQKLANPGRLKYYDGLTEKKGDRTEWTGTVNFVPEALSIPLKWRKPRRIFVNSMSDLFHGGVEDHELDQIFAVMALTPQHTYQVLTKRPDRMLEYMTTKNRHGKVLLSARGNSSIPPGLYPLAPNWPLPNVWLGVTVENQKAADDRIPLLAKAPAALRFLSCEPLLEEIKISHHLKTDLINWVIVGGESGNGARKCRIEWLDSIRQQIQEHNKFTEYPVKLFVKQLGSQATTADHDRPEIVSVGNCAATTGYPHSKPYPCTGKGAIVSEWPDCLQIQEFPQN